MNSELVLDLIATRKTHVEGESMIESNEGFMLAKYQRAYREVRAGQEKLGFKINLAAYILVNTLLVTINLLLAQEFPWVIFPIVCWGIGLMFHYTFGIRRLEWRLEAEEAKAERIASN